MTCAKKIVTCHIVAESGDVFSGTNDCANPQTSCPREFGESYEKCNTICQQNGHAEIKALQSAGDHNLKNAVVYLQGITHYCRLCQEALFDAGVKFLSRGEYEE